VIDGFPEAARFQAELKIAGEKLTIERGKIVGNPLEGLAFEIGCSEKLRKRGVKTVCEGPVLTLNARLEIHRIEIPGGSLRRVGRFRPEDETPRNSEGFFLDGRWEACSPK
jgi:hypothetical protein